MDNVASVLSFIYACLQNNYDRPNEESDDEGAAADDGNILNAFFECMEFSVNLWRPLRPKLFFYLSVLQTTLLFCNRQSLLSIGKQIVESLVST